MAGAPKRKSPPGRLSTVVPAVGGQGAAIYPGTFDPITFGHVDLIRRSLQVFPDLTILVARSGKKRPVLSAEERKKLIESCFPGEPRLHVDIHEGLLVDYARTHGVKVVIRGLRAVSDFEYEFQMATINRRMYPQLETFFLMASESFFFVNSTLVKEVVSLGGDISELVPAQVEKALRKHLC